ncbi:hypothetical protein CFC21_040042, partial [Triticum aestivum]
PLLDPLCSTPRSSVSPPLTAPSPRCAVMLMTSLWAASWPPATPAPGAATGSTRSTFATTSSPHLGRGHVDCDHGDSLLHPLPREELLLDCSLCRMLRSWHRLRRYDPANLPAVLSVPASSLLCRCRQQWHPTPPRPRRANRLPPCRVPPQHRPHHRLH